MRTRYPFTRVIATLLGVWMAWIHVETLRNYLGGCPPGCRVPSTGGFSWASVTPTFDFCLAIAWESLVVVGTVTMWTHPRAGFFIAGMGYQLYWTLTLVDVYCEWCTHSLEQGMWILRILAIPVWLYYVGVKDEPRPQSVPTRA